MIRHLGFPSPDLSFLLQGPEATRMGKWASELVPLKISFSAASSSLPGFVKCLLRDS